MTHKKEAPPPMGSGNGAVQEAEATFTSIVPDHAAGSNSPQADPAKAAPTTPADREVTLLDGKSPDKAAIEFCKRRMPHVRVWQQDVYDWRDGAYRVRSDAYMRSQVRKFLAKCKVAVYENKGGRKVGRKTVGGKLEVADYAWFDPRVKDVNEVLQSVLDHRHLPEHEFAPPCWLLEVLDDKRRRLIKDMKLEAERLLAFPNGLLDLRSRMFFTASPALFTTAACGFDYEEPESSKPAAPPQWLKFLDEIFDGEQEQIDLLQEWFGYCLSTDASLDKALVLVGPARSGKGTVMQMQRELLSPDSVVGPTLAQMQTNFGMSAVIAKRLAIVDDVRVGARTDMNAVTENVLNLTGRKWWTLDRKFKAPWSGYMPCKLAIISNEMPAWRDDSGVIATRLLSLRTRVSFLGSEEPRLFRDYLQPERAQVLHWALEGERRIRENGAFTESATSQEERGRNEATAAPHLSFMRECLKVEGAERIRKDDLVDNWESYCREAGRHAGNRDWLIRNLNKVLPRPLVEVREKGERWLVGVRALTDAERRAASGEPDLVDRAQEAPKRDDDSEFPF